MKFAGVNSVDAMDIMKAYSYLTSHGIALLRALSQLSPYDVAGLGIGVKNAKAYAKLADVFFGPADSPRLQKDSVALAEERGLSLEYLKMVNYYAAQLKARGKAWKLRAELIAHQGSFEEVQKHAAERLKAELEPAPPTAGVKISGTNQGMRTITITDTTRAITDFEKSLDTLADDNPQLSPRDKALLDAFWLRLERGGKFSPKFSTVIAVGLEDFAKVFSGAADEVRVGLSDGSTMTGKELVNAAVSGALGDDLFAGLFHPVKGPVNLYKARFASFKQRLLAKAENLVCPWPDCNVPADRCQIHHIDAHKHGGHTEPTNLTTLCRYHNGVNDDDPQTPTDNQRRKHHRKHHRKRPSRGGASRGGVSRGRVHRHRGRVRYTSPGGRMYSNHHDVSDLGAMNLI